MTRLALITHVLVVLAGCSSTGQAGKVTTTGFLGDYTQLRKGKAGEALLVYRNPQADFSKYDKVLVEPIAIWGGADRDPSELSAQEAQSMAGYLRRAVEAQLMQDYQIVESPGPGTLRIRGAITEATQSWVPLDTVTTVEPFTRIFSEIKKLTTGTHAFVGRASVEAEITDAETGERLLAAVDRREGNKRLKGSQSSWGDVKEAFDYWAERLRERLRAERAAPIAPIDGAPR